MTEQLNLQSNQPATPLAFAQPATRSAGLAKLTDFIPRAGSAYAKNRNHDLGPGNRENVSCLSPYVRHRLVSEQEICRQALGVHAFSTAEKFVQEVCWRTYWKGWLERHPGVWPMYLRQIESDRADLVRDGALRQRFETAVSGQTGIECFDAWARELVEIGYVHNHARMWFASIWIFTLRLPWSLGADFFLTHLLDGDAASNTLGWRWVAGLQTKGKTYLARSGNITQYTDGRFDVPSGALAPSAPALHEDVDYPLADMPHCPSVPSDEPFGLLLHEDDLLGGEGIRLPGDPAALCVLGPDGFDRTLGAGALAFKRGACADAAVHHGADFGLPCAQLEAGETTDACFETVRDWARSAGVETIAMPYCPIGYVADRLDPVARRLEADAGIVVIPQLRDWDAGFWPHATRGFFKLKEQIPNVLADVGLLDVASLPPSRQPGRSKKRGKAA